ncbi:MAG: translational GTPase TypA [Gemmatimonadetes bacterium]|nr:translational GTPase TypA [Gemmatimonadota bacterium]MBK9065333.1 translational GTPase TypA [Gemmatimonadota bacterium]MBP9200250.1 translational GTPase TypA [Gemmatimonadales bacterium]
MAQNEQIRNIAIIAHVDHGKTTLVDQMLRQAGAFRANQHVEERVMDSNPLERERGITILAKNTAVRWGDTKINIVDTPGHADFGGEVERILRMVDGVLILVDAAEGPMPQTRFVTRKALALGHQPIVAINKIDRQDAEPLRVHDEVLGLFIDLEASHEQLDAPFLYTSSRAGTATLELDQPGTDLKPLFEAILKRVPPPTGEGDGPFQMLISTLDFSTFVGRMGIGRIERGRVRVGQEVALLPIGVPGMVVDEAVSKGRITKLMTFDGLNKVETEEVAAGDIAVIAGIEGIEIGRTLTAVECPERLEGIAVEEPTMSVDFIVNNSPFAGREGKFVTSRQVRDRLFRELERNVALKVEDTDSPDTWAVSGRGELHLGILMETMRREGFEFQVSRPRVITKVGPDGERLEPYEELMADVPEGYIGTVIEKLGPRRAELIEMKNPGQGMVRMNFRIPARGLFGYRSEFLTDTRGTGTLHHRFLEYGAWAGPLAGRKNGVLVADRVGEAVGFALFNLQERAQMFISPGDEVYEGMVCGENSRPGDMDVNVAKEKKLTNMRTTASDENIQLETPRQITLEYALEYIEEDELIEVTPKSIRLRKRALAATDRKKMARAAARADAS